MQPTNIFWQLFHHGAHISKEHHIPLKDHAFRGQESQGESGLSKAVFSWEIPRQRIQPPWWYNKPMQAPEGGHFFGKFCIARLIPMVSNGIQWSYRRDWHLASFLQAEAPGRIRSNFSWSAKLIRVYRIYAESMPLCFPDLPCIHAGRWPNAAGCALKSWAPGSRKYSSGKFGMRLLT